MDALGDDVVDAICDELDILDKPRRKLLDDLLRQQAKRYVALEKATRDRKKTSIPRERLKRLIKALETFDWELAKLPKFYQLKTQDRLYKRDDDYLEPGRFERELADRLAIYKDCLARLDQVKGAQDRFALHSVIGAFVYLAFGEWEKLHGAYIAKETQGREAKFETPAARALRRFLKALDPNVEDTTIISAIEKVKAEHPAEDDLERFAPAGMTRAQKVLLGRDPNLGFKKARALLRRSI